jgi:ribosomal protein S6E (S10)
MAFKINLSTKDGKTYKLEAEAPSLKQKQIGDKIKGEDISTDFSGYELEITGASDKAGFTAMKNVQGVGLKKALLSYGKAMHKRPKGEKKKNKKPAGLRLRKTVRGNTISDAISQINIKVLKEGGKKLSEIFPDQNKKPETEKPEAPEQAESITESPAQKQVDKELAKPEEEPKQEKAEKPEEQKP